MSFERNELHSKLEAMIGWETQIYSTGDLNLHFIPIVVV